MAIGPRCLRCLMLILSGPEELLFLDCFIARMVSDSVIVIGVDVNDLVVCLLFYEWGWRSVLWLI